MVKGNQVHVKDSAVSQNHAEVLYDGKQWTITDLGSSNGADGASLACPQRSFMDARVTPLYLGPCRDSCQREGSC